MTQSGSWHFRIADSGDIDTLVQFNCRIALETEGKQLDPATVTQGVRRGMQQGDEVVYYVADAGSGPIGALMLTREWSDWRNGWLAWVQSVYVLPDYRGSGVFRSLLQHVLGELKANADVVGVRLYVEVDNSRALEVYERSGFSDPHYKVLEMIF